MPIIHLRDIRLVGRNKHYYAKQLETYANFFPAVEYIEFSKFEISFPNKTIYFKNKDEMLGYIVGFNSAMNMCSSSKE